MKHLFLEATTRPRPDRPDRGPPTVTLAADHCPPRTEGFSFAVMTSLINLATASGDIVGSYLFDHLFHQKLTPSAAFTAVAFVLVPLLRLGDKRQGETADAMAVGGPVSKGAHQQDSV